MSFRKELETEEGSDFESRECSHRRFESHALGEGVSMNGPYNTLHRDEKRYKTKWRNDFVYMRMFLSYNSLFVPTHYSMEKVAVHCCQSNIFKFTFAKFMSRPFSLKEFR